MANTLKFGNGEWYGKKDTILAYNDENSNYKPLLFNFSRASKATVINKDGLIEEVGSGQPRVDYLNNTKGAMLLEPSRTNLITQSESFPNSYWTKSGASIQADPSTQGSELITNGGFDTDSDWNKGAGWTISGGSLNGSSTTSTAFQINTGLVSGKIYEVVYTISNYVSGSVRIELGSGNVSVGSIRSANGTYIEYIEALGDDRLYFDGIVSFTGSIDNVSVKEVQGFTSPDGTNNAYKLVEGTNNGNHSISATVLVNSGNNSFSMYVKENGRKHISLYTNSRGSENDQYGFYLNGSGSVTFNNTNGDATITSLSNGWYRVSITHPSSGYNTRLFKLYLSDSEVSSNTIPSYQGDGLKGVYIYGSQVEAGSYSTSAISTSGSTVTRSRDLSDTQNLSHVIGQTEGVIFYDAILVHKSTSTSEDLFELSIDDGSNQNIFFINNYNNSLTVAMVNGSSYQFTNNSYNPTEGERYKLAFAYKQNDFALYINGNQIATDSNGTVPTMNQITFGNYYNNQLNLANSVKINDFKLYNTRLSNSELQALTS
jgi:hypothetical protein